MIQQLKANWKSGLSVALISVPLSLSLGIASGTTPVAGIITAIWAGLIAGLVGGSQFNIIGPAGALSGILALYAAQYGPGILPFLALGAGLISILVWFLRWDRYLTFVPSSVVHGFTLGVAITIASGQFNSALGLNGLAKHESVIENIFETLKNIGSTDFAAFIPFLIAIAILFFILKKRPLWPNSIVVALLGIGAGYASKLGWIPLAMTTLGDKYPSLALNLFSIPSFSQVAAHPVLVDLAFSSQLTLIFRLSAVVAFVLVLETLLSGKIADGMTKTKFDQRREVLGVALANLGAGLFGGVPASGVFARTAMNVKSGAKSQYSQVINAVFVALITFVLLPAFNYIPMSIIAAILIYVAVRMVTTEHFKKLYAYDKSAFGTAMAVAALSIVYDATIGIIVGTAAALLFLVNKISRAQCTITVGAHHPLTEQTEGDVLVYRFAGELTYVNSKSHIETFATLPHKKAIVLNFRHLFYLDLDGVEALHEIVDHLKAHGRAVYITGLNEHIGIFVKDQHWYHDLKSEGHVFEKTEDAVASAHTSN